MSSLPLPRQPMTGPEEHRALAETRSKTWWLLSRFYLERPDAAFLQELRALFCNLGEAVGDRERSLFQALHEDDPALEQRLLQDFTRLFRGLRQGDGPPPPYESIHRGAPLMGDLAVEVRRHYEDAGLGQLATGGALPDHLGVELRFLALLCFREMEAWADRDSDLAAQAIARQRSFMDRHLLAWAPGYLERTEARAREPFYASVLALTRDFVETTRQDLDQLQCDLQAA